MSKKRKENLKDKEQLQKIFDQTGLHANIDLSSILEEYDLDFDLTVESDPDKLSFEDKVIRSKLLILEAVEQFGSDRTYISFSGGKDSSIVAHLVHSVYSEITLVFANTGLELPEIVAFVKKQKKVYGKNVEILRPKKNFKQVLEEYGFPIISKQVSMAISRWQNTKSALQKKLRWEGGFNPNTGKNQKMGVIPNKWKHLATEIKTTERCCYYFKKQPFNVYEQKLRKELKIPKDAKILNFAGTRSNESNLRRQDFRKHGCNSFKKGHPQSRPIMFWNDADVNRYIQDNSVEICEVYYDKWEVDPITGEEIFIPAELRTGCIFCMYGVHLEEKGNTRFHKLQKRHPKLFKYAMDKLGLREVLKKYAGIEFNDKK